MLDPLRRALTLLSIAAPVRPLTGPYSIRLEASSLCNFSCRMCLYHSTSAKNGKTFREGLLNTATCIRLLEGAKQIGVRSVLFIGRGEPLMNPDLPRFVKLAQSLGLRTRLYTNGSLLTRRKLEELIESGLDTLSVSMVAPSPESYARFHPDVSPQTFHRIVDSLDLLQQLKRQAQTRDPKLELHYILLDQSHLETGRMVDLSTQLGADAVRLSALMFRSVGGIGSLAPSQSEERLAIDRLRELMSKAAGAKPRIDLDDVTLQHLHGSAGPNLPCYGSWIEANSRFDGSITYCMRSPGVVGNVNERPLKEIWFGSDYQALRRSFVNPAERARTGEFDCAYCGLFCASWQIMRRLSTFGLAPKCQESPQIGTTK